MIYAHILILLSTGDNTRIHYTKIICMELGRFQVARQFFVIPENKLHLDFIISGFHCRLIL